MLAIATVPEALPAAVDSKVTVRDVLCPANNVSGSEMPDTPNPFPDAAICVTFKAADPRFDISSVCA